VAAGSGTVVATAVGRDSYAYRLGEDARRFTLVRSELRDGINAVIRVATWILVPTGALLAVSQLRRGDDLVDAVQGSVAGMVAMVPEGLILLTSTALAVSVIRLGAKKVLTQELAAIEGLARVDTICLDKTGTLTEGRLGLGAVEVLPGAGTDEAAVRDVLGTMVAADPNPNPSLAAIGAGVSERTDWDVVTAVPFSSARKWSATDLGGHGAWLLGAPDILLGAAAPAVADAARAEVDALAAAGRRVILLARAPDGLAGEDLPTRLEPVALTVLDETVRPEAPDTIAYFGAQGVAVKVISGDSPVTVGAVAARVGVPGAEHPVDARTLPDDPAELGLVLEERSVFGRVTPHQKRAMVQAMQARGHEVAMTGDGVNDTLALKDAEIGVAMGTGSPAARAVARFVLLDNSFAVFPSVVSEGRRVIANVERVANLFLTKTFYAMFLSLTVGVIGLPFPFLPRHLTLVSALTIGIPGFFLALAPSSRRARPGFLDRVLRFALPAGLVCGIATLGGYYVGRLERQSLAQDRTTALIVLFLVAFWVLALLARPFTPLRAGLVGSMGGLFFLALTLPFSQDYFEIALPSPAVLLEAVAVAVAACVLLELGWHAASWVDRRWGPAGATTTPDRDEDPAAPLLIPRTVPFNASPLRDAWDRRTARRRAASQDPGPPEDGPG
jgi:cation-transporting ATPase E